MIPNDPNQHKPRDRKKVILRLGKYLLQHKWMVLAAVSLTITGNLLALLGPMLSGYAIDAIGVGPGHDQLRFGAVLLRADAGVLCAFFGTELPAVGADGQNQPEDCLSDA